jgi:hypothetical protein
MGAKDLPRCTERKIRPTGSAWDGMVKLSISDAISSKTGLVYTYAMILCAFPPLFASRAPRFVLGTHPSPVLIAIDIGLVRHAGNQLT